MTTATAVIPTQDEMQNWNREKFDSNVDEHPLLELNKTGRPYDELPTEKQEELWDDFKRDRRTRSGIFSKNS